MTTDAPPLTRRRKIATGEADSMRGRPASHEPEWGPLERPASRIPDFATGLLAMPTAAAVTVRAIKPNLPESPTAHHHDAVEVGHLATTAGAHHAHEHRVADQHHDHRGQKQ